MAAAAMTLEGRGETTIETETKDLLLQITVGVKQGLHLEINHISKNNYEFPHHYVEIRVILPLIAKRTLTIVTFEDKAK